MEVVNMGGDAVVPAPSGVRVGRGPDAAVPDDALHLELLRHGHDRIGECRPIRCAVRTDAEVSSAPLTMQGGGAATPDGAAVVDASVHAALALVSGQKVVHRAPHARL